MLEQVTPLILTWDEAPNIGRTLARLRWARRILVVDSYSSDATERLCGSVPAIEFLKRRFDDHASQWNFGLGFVRSDWVLALDADYLVSDAFIKELTRLAPAPSLAAYSARFRYCVGGQPLRRSLYPPRPVLFRRDRCRYVMDGHTQRLLINGTSGWLGSPIDHDDRKPMSRWLQDQDHYARLEARKLIVAGRGELGLPDRLRRLVVVAPMAVFAYTLIGKGLLLEGWRGFHYALQRALAETILSLRLIEARWQRDVEPGP